MTLRESCNQRSDIDRFTPPGNDEVARLRLGGLVGWVVLWWRRALRWQDRWVTGLARNQIAPSQLSRRDVAAALRRIAARDHPLARDAEDAFEWLTCGEGPGALRQYALQLWLWYVVPTQYFTDEIDSLGRTAVAVAALFDELGLHGYAAICRSDETATVYAAFGRGSRHGLAAVRKAMHRSGVVAPHLVDFEWSSHLGPDEAAARAAVEDALEQALANGQLRAGGRGWRIAQAAVAAAALDSDHPELPGQSWRTAVTTERLDRWVGEAQERSAPLGKARMDLAKRLLHPIPPPSDAADAMAPLMWLLRRIGDEQPLTVAGYLTPSFIASLRFEQPWGRDCPETGPPQTEANDRILGALRFWLQRAGALRKRKGMLQRTAAGRAMATDPAVAWDVFTRTHGASEWQRFAFETAMLFMVGHRGGVPKDDPLDFVVSSAADMGWAAAAGGEKRLLDSADVSWSLDDPNDVWQVCGLIVECGEWHEVRTDLTEAGEAAALTCLRHIATGPVNSP